MPQMLVLLLLLSLTTTVFTLCIPRAPCTSCAYLSRVRDAFNCRLYYECYYGSPMTTRLCGPGLIYSLRYQHCVWMPSGFQCVAITPPPPTRPPTINTNNGWRRGMGVGVGRGLPFRTPAHAPTNTEQAQSFPSDTQCGIKVSRYIAGGQGAERAEWPWQVSLQVYDFRSGKFVHMCGGTLVSASWIVTAGHCVRIGSTTLNLMAVAGQFRLHANDPWRQSRAVAQTVVHPGFQDRGNYPNDIALLRLASPFNLTTAVRPACLPTSDQEPRDLSATNRFNPHYTTSSCWTTGWGQETSETSGPSLKEVGVRVVERWTCTNRWPGYIKPFHLCAVSTRGTACKGDSGGPLVCANQGRYFLQGVISWGDGTCAIKEMPNVYTRVGYYMKWIHNTLHTYNNDNTQHTYNSNNNIYG